MVAFLEFLWTVSAILMIVLVLLHSPKGDGIAAIGGQAQLFSSTKSAEQSLNRITWTVLAVFLILSVVLALGLFGPTAQLGLKDLIG
ncbi:MAG: preprotein translocase subunit SecG [Cyanobacteria bacterium P01_E01_bin.34]